MAFTLYAYAHPSWADVARVVHNHFGVTALRPGQRELIEAVLAGRDALSIRSHAGSSCRASSPK